MRTHLDNSYPGSKIVLTKKARRFIGTRRNDGDGNLRLLYLEAHAARVKLLVRRSMRRRHRDLSKRLPRFDKRERSLVIVAVHSRQKNCGRLGRGGNFRSLGYTGS